MHRLVLCVSRDYCSASILVLCALISPAISQQKPVRLDSSDWWSYTRQEEIPPSHPAEPTKDQSRDPGENNFQIAGIALGELSDFSGARSKLGEATEVERGDAASGRNQICFVSDSASVHLIFELGEVNSAVYLFEGGPKWQGSELCSFSNKVSENTSTASGLRLGVTPSQVKRILGEANIETPEKLIYHFGYKRKTTPEELAQLHKDHPDASDSELRDWKYADAEVYVETRFGSGKLNYLAISKSETY